MKDIIIYTFIALAMMAFLFPACVQGLDHSMEIDTDLVLWGWGYNGEGQLGQGHNSNELTPVILPLTPLTGDLVSVCTGDHHTCVLDSLKNVACTGKDVYGQQGVDVGQSNTNVLRVPTGVALVDHLACGPSIVLATTTTGTLLVWGRDSHGQLGRGTTDAAVWVAEVSFVFSYIHRRTLYKTKQEISV
jgi:alpha-tubulin suppressor-like RCC1 family protein